jgi:hypothetical protein
MAGYGYNSPGTRIGNYVWSMLGLFAHRLNGLSIHKHCRARSPSYSHRDKSHLWITEIDVRTTWVVGCQEEAGSELGQCSGGTFGKNAQGLGLM